MPHANLTLMLIRPRWTAKYSGNNPKAVLVASLMWICKARNVKITQTLEVTLHVSENQYLLRMLTPRCPEVHVRKLGKHVCTHDHMSLEYICRNE